MSIDWKGRLTSMPHDQLLNLLDLIVDEYRVDLWEYREEVAPEYRELLSRRSGFGVSETENKTVLGDK